MAYGKIPAAANAQVGALGTDEHHAGIGCKLGQCLGRAVGGVVVDHQHVVGKVGLLCEHAAHSVGNGAYTVANGNDNAGLHGVVGVVVRQVVELVGSQPGTYGLEVVGGGTFHFLLHLAVARVDVVELLLA